MLTIKSERFMKEKIITLLLLPICLCQASPTIEEMRRENDQRMDRMMDRLSQEREHAEGRKGRYEQERVNRILIERGNKRLFGD
jgi:hypothetical protein